MLSEARERDRKQLVQRCSDAIKQVQVRFSGKGEIATGQDATVVCLCQALERLLQFGLKGSHGSASTATASASGITGGSSSGGSGGSGSSGSSSGGGGDASSNGSSGTEPPSSSSSSLLENTGQTVLKLIASTFQREITLWSYVKIFLDQRELDRIAKLPHISSDIGKVRAWLRLALNEHMLDRFFGIFAKNLKITMDFFEPYAVLMDEELTSIVKMLLTGLSSVVFAIAVDDGQLNNDTSLALEVSRAQEKELASAKTASGAYVPPAVYAVDPSIAAKPKKKAKKKRIIENVETRMTPEAAAAAAAVAAAVAAASTSVKSDDEDASSLFATDQAGGMPSNMAKSKSSNNALDFSKRSAGIPKVNSSFGELATFPSPSSEVSTSTSPKKRSDSLSEISTIERVLETITGKSGFQPSFGATAATATIDEKPPLPLVDEQHVSVSRQQSEEDRPEDKRLAATAPPKARSFEAEAEEDYGKSLIATASKWLPSTSSAPPSAPSSASSSAPSTVPPPASTTTATAPAAAARIQPPPASSALGPLLSAPSSYSSLQSSPSNPPLGIAAIPSSPALSPAVSAQGFPLPRPLPSGVSMNISAMSSSASTGMSAAELKQAVLAMTRRKDELQSENNQLTAKVSQQQSQIEALTDENEILKKEVAHYRDSIRELQQETDSLRTFLRSLNMDPQQAAAKSQEGDRAKAGGGLFAPEDDGLDGAIGVPVSPSSNSLLSLVSDEFDEDDGSVLGNTLSSQQVKAIRKEHKRQASSVSAKSVHSSGSNGDSSVISAQEKKLKQLSEMNQELLELNQRLYQQLNQQREFGAVSGSRDAFQRTASINSTLSTVSALSTVSRTPTMQAAASGRSSVAVVSKDQWTSDKEVASCTLCDRQFTFQRRRHHCRCCGGVYCSKCANNFLPLSRPGSTTKTVRVCDGCKQSYLNL